jgi:CheY-like chemotaxis protein
MPEKSGLEILSTLRSMQINTPFILTSGYIEEYLQHPDLKMVDQLLPKPIEINLLLETVKKFLI